MGLPQDGWERVIEDTPETIAAQQEVLDMRMDALEGQVVDLYKRLNFKKGTKWRKWSTKPVDLEIHPNDDQGLQNLIFIY